MALLCGGGGSRAADVSDPARGNGGPASKAGSSRRTDADKNVVKLLLLGAGESGKSTLFKQMKVINKGGYSDEERKSFIPVVHSNTIISMKTLITAFEQLGVTVPPSIQELCDQLPEDEGGGKLSPAAANAIHTMWKHKTVQEVFARKSEFQLDDSAEYFFDKVTTLSSDTYIPTEQDVLRARVRTTGIARTDFKIKHTDFAMFDLGGQRNERRKWIHTFKDVHAVIFVAALSEFDQVLFEDSTRNRMLESLSLFEQIANSRWFTETSMILFLNKHDLFQRKLEKTHIKDYFEDYTGAKGGSQKSFDEGCAFFKEKFLAESKNKDKSIYTHITCATDTKNVSFVFNAVVCIILEANMKQAGFF